MSNKAAFLEIVSGQLPPDEWYHHRLNEDFSEVNPNSQLGELLLRTARDQAYADQQLDLMEEEERWELGLVNSDEEIATETIWNITTDRMTICCLFHKFMSDHLDSADTATESPEAAYSHALIDTHESIVRYVEGLEIEGMPPRVDLRVLIGQLLTFYGAEAPLHFSETMDRLRLQTWLAASS